MLGDGGELPSLYGPDYFPTADSIENDRTTAVDACEEKKRKILSGEIKLP